MNRSGTIAGGGDNEVNTFPKCTDVKVNVIARCEFALAYNDVAVQHVNYYALGTPATLRKTLQNDWLILMTCQTV